MKQFGQVSENISSMYIAQVLEGLRYLHSEGIIHRDIKGGNILITSQKHVKLAGMTRVVHLICRFWCCVSTG